MWSVGMCVWECVFSVSACYRGSLWPIQYILQCFYSDTKRENGVFILKTFFTHKLQVNFTKTVKREIFSCNLFYSVVSKSRFYEKYLCTDPIFSMMWKYIQCINIILDIETLSGPKEQETHWNKSSLDQLYSIRFFSNYLPNLVHIDS